MTPSSRRKRPSGARGWSCSSRPTMCKRADCGRSRALFRARADGACRFPPGIACLTTASRPSPTSKAAAGDAGGACAPQGAFGPRRGRHHRQCPSAARAAARGDRGRELFARVGDDGRSRRAGRVSSPPTAMCAPARCASRAISRCAAASSICGRRERAIRCGSISSAPTLDAIRRFDAETQLSPTQVTADRTSARQRSAARRGLHQPLPRRLCRRVRPGERRSAL